MLIEKLKSTMVNTDAQRAVTEGAIVLSMLFLMDTVDGLTWIIASLKESNMHVARWKELVADKQFTLKIGKGMKRTHNPHSHSKMH